MNANPAMPPSGWLPFLREAGIASGCLVEGLGKLRRANHAEHNLYSQAFFDLSIGFERLLKLIVLIDHAIENAGSYPTTEVFKHQYGHDLTRLFGGACEIRQRRASEGLERELVDAAVADRMMEVLGEFATSTRYYNFDVLTRQPAKAKGRDPLTAWSDDVVPLLLRNYRPSRRKADEVDAEELHRLLDPVSLIRFTAEDGSALTSVRDTVVHERLMQHVQKEATFQCATIVRYLAELLRILCYHSRPGGPLDVPYLYEFFTVFENEDAYLRRRKTFR